MPKSFKLTVLTPEKVFYSGDAEIVIIRTTSGEEGFMANHQWACKIIVPGEMKIKEKGAKKSDFKLAAVSDGYIKAAGDITIYTDAAEWPQEIDLDRAERAKKRAEEKLKISNQTKYDKVEAEIALHRAIARIKVKSDAFETKK